MCAKIQPQKSDQYFIFQDFSQKSYASASETPDLIKAR